MEKRIEPAKYPSDFGKLSSTNALGFHRDGRSLHGLQKQLDLTQFQNQKILEHEFFLGKKISILQNGLNGKESYTGVCISITPEGIYIKILADYKYDLHYIRHEHIISILRYNEITQPIY